MQDEFIYTCFQDLFAVDFSVIKIKFGLGFFFWFCSISWLSVWTSTFGLSILPSQLIFQCFKDYPWVFVAVIKINTAPLGLSTWQYIFNGTDAVLWSEEIILKRKVHKVYLNERCHFFLLMERKDECKLLNLENWTVELTKACFHAYSSHILVRYESGLAPQTEDSQTAGAYSHLLHLPFKHFSWHTSALQ